jgi:predicted DNA binding CopG/RHH family protein
MEIKVLLTSEFSKVEPLSIHSSLSPLIIIAHNSSLEKALCKMEIPEGRKMKKSVLDDEEKVILESYESGEWVSVKDQVQLIAVQEGIPYQTLVSSIIHK